MFDEKGKQYLDLIGGILVISVGHKNPHVNKAVIDQYNKIIHNSTLYLNPAMGALAKKIADKLPKKLSKVLLVNSGSEANDLAVMMARLHTGNDTVFALNGAYHGWAGNAMGLTGVASWKYPVPHGHGIKHVHSCYDYHKMDYLTTE